MNNSLREKSSEIVKIICCFLSSFFICLCSFSFGCSSDNGDSEPDSRQEIKIGSDEYRPFFFVDGDGMFSGIDVEIATEAFSRMGYKAKFVQIEWNRKDILLKNGDIDCLWGCFSMDGRAATYKWAGPYMNSDQVILVRSEDNIKSLSDLNGKSVAVQATSKPDEIFSDMISSGELKLKNLLCFTSIDNVFASLRKGYADAIAGHMAAIQERIKNYADGRYVYLSEPLLRVKLGVAFSLSADSEIVSALSAVLKNMIEDGSVKEIAEKYGLSADYALDGLN